jgi:DHA1 family tetracycline resistance protein-like MFS transporter
MKKASMLTIFLIVFVDLVGFGIVLPNLQLYGQQYGISNYFYLTLIGVTYSIFQFLFAPILGRWSDRVGRRPVLIISQIGTIVGYLMLFASIFFRSSPLGIVLIFASRVVDGISGGNLSTASAYIADITTPENRAKGFGVIGAAFGLGFMFGPLIGGTVSKFFGLQYVPLAAAVFGLTALTMTITRLAESRNLATDNAAAQRRFSVRGLEHALKRPVVGMLIMLFFVNGFAFAGMEQTLSLLIQHRLFPLTPPVAVPPDINRVLLVPGGGSAVSAAKTHQVSPEAYRKKQDSAAAAASGFLFGAIGIVIVIVQGGLIKRLTKRFGEWKLAIAGPLFISAGLLLIGLPIHWAWPWTGFLAGGVCLAIGGGLYNPSIQSLISRHCSADEQGEILGANQGMASLARATGPILAGVLFEYVFPSSVYYVSASLCFIVALAVMSRRRAFALPPAAEPAAH